MARAENTERFFARVDAAEQIYRRPPRISLSSGRERNRASSMTT
jgi:hypothetical protein